MASTNDSIGKAINVMIHIYVRDVRYSVLKNLCVISATNGNLRFMSKCKKEKTPTYYLEIYSCPYLYASAQVFAFSPSTPR